ncbi:MAG: hypothetical protein H6721_17390 [Sandaracinus sp.]|nr:hypothetical protein [Sandaracinus sp.]MCB9622816.1 hypothetical protein [Sandaracinus sp.]MCB9633896.1 hypothetical protein [Sandaracinus sp.]
MSKPGSIVILERHLDPVAAQMRAEVLRSAGIDVSTPGLQHGQMLGSGANYVVIPIQVRAEDEERAREVLEGLENPDELLEGPIDPTPPAGEGPYRGGEAVDRSYGDERKKRVAAFCSLALTFGSGHFYAREATTGWLLFGLEAAAFVLGMRFGVEWMSCIPVLMLYDLVGGLRACDRHNGGKSFTPGQQLARAPIVLALAGAAVFVAPHLETEEPAVEGWDDDWPSPPIVY